MYISIVQLNWAAIELWSQVGVCVCCILRGLDDENVFLDTEFEHLAQAFLSYIAAAQVDTSNVVQVFKVGHES